MVEANLIIGLPSLREGSADFSTPLLLVFSWSFECKHPVVEDLRMRDLLDFRSHVQLITTTTRALQLFQREKFFNTLHVQHH